METNKIPIERKNKLDSLYEAFSIIGDDTYVYLCDMKYDCSRWSKDLVDAFGLPGEYMYGAGDIWEEHIHPDDRKVFHEGIQCIFSGKSAGHDMQYRAKKKNGEYVVCTCRGIVINDEQGQPEYFGGAIRNHDQQGHIDSLTGLRNQYGFFEDVKRHINNKTPMRVCIMGIGRLTEINEMYGYGVGNKVLQYFGRYLMDHVGNRGGTYRLDGAKFAIIAETQSFREIKKSYEAIRRRFRQGLHIDDVFIMVELNAGTISLEDFATDTQTIYSCLNYAYQDSKLKKHGDMVEFLNHLKGDKRNQTEMIYAIRESINQNFKGFYLLYQPIIDSDTEEVKGAEALLRWRDEKYGMVPPDEFIPVLERDPLFPKLGEWILRTAMEDTKEIQKIIPEFMIHINLSYAQLERIDFTDTVWNVVESVKFEPEYLCLEVTERCKLLDMDLLENVLVSLRAGGIHVALDDFGTGYSSVSLLKSMYFDTIKIDKIFVQRIEENEKERALLNNLSQIALLYSGEVCAEGIETRCEGDVLKTYGIQKFQGYYYSKPIELEKFLGHLNTDEGTSCFKKNEYNAD
ncbi:MAG: EAL domain-containing protein [Lachnospiraceae bacterium]|nr:EAL domain-containing protein [Lachnospiraceae bacterium]